MTTVNGARISGTSSSIPPVVGGTTDIRIIVLMPTSSFVGQTFPVGSRPQSVAVADLNADGAPDIVTANYFSHDVSVLLGNGNGAFHDQQRFAVGSRPFSVAVADLNADGALDIVTADLSDDVSVLLQQ